MPGLLRDRAGEAPVDVVSVRAGGWPEPYLQPDRNQDCGFYTTAYIVRCLG